MDKIVQLFKPKPPSNLQKAIEELQQAEPQINSVVIIYTKVDDNDEGFISYYWHSKNERSSSVLGLIEYMKHIIIEYMLDN